MKMLGERFVLVVAAGLASAAVATSARAQQAPPNVSAAQEAAAPPAPPTPPNAKINTAEDLLNALERADKGLESLAADIQYVKRFSEVQGGDSQERRGKLVYVVKPPVVEGARGKRGFSVTFDTLLAGGQKRDENRQFVFDGEHYVERDETNKQFIKRRIVAPGQQADPLKIGEGPFPVPIGQAKADILSRFGAELVPMEEGLDPKAAANRIMKDALQLKLVPKPGTVEAKNFAMVRLWYRAGDLLPRRAMSTAPDGTVTDILLINQRLNQAVDADALNVAKPSGADWTIDVQEDLRGETIVLPASEKGGTGAGKEPDKSGAPK